MDQGSDKLNVEEEILNKHKKEKKELQGNSYNFN